MRFKMKRAIRKFVGGVLITIMILASIGTVLLVVAIGCVLDSTTYWIAILLVLGGLVSLLLSD